jgi:hypothetical protein
MIEFIEHLQLVTSINETVSFIRPTQKVELVKQFPN